MAESLPRRVGPCERGTVAVTPRHLVLARSEA